MLTKEIEVKLGCQNAKETDKKRFEALVNKYGLDPYAGEIFFIGGTMITIGKDGYFMIADKNPYFDGIEDGIIYKLNNQIVNGSGTFLPPGAELLGGWAKVFRKDRSHAKYSTVNLQEYNNQKNLWQRMPAVMINKVAKTTALRDAFPSAFNGIYDEAEVTEPVNNEVPGTANKQEGMPLQEALHYDFGECSLKQFNGQNMFELLKKAKKPRNFLEKIKKSTDEDLKKSFVAVDRILHAMDTGELDLPDLPEPEEKEETKKEG